MLDVNVCVFVRVCFVVLLLTTAFKADKNDKKLRLLALSLQQRQQQHDTFFA
jgi:hypothetical protein